MRITIVSMDTRGGVQPYVALALGLRRAGHEVRAVAPADLAELFTARGVPVAALDGSIEEVLRGSGGAAERGAIASMRLVARELPRRIVTWTRQCLDACGDADVITGGIGGMVVGLSVAEKLQRPFIEAHLQPVGPAHDQYPGILLPGTPKWLGRWGMRASHHLTDLGLWGPFRGAMRAARETALGLKGRPAVSPRHPVLYGFSRHVVPMPAVDARPRHVTGYWFLPAGEAWRPPPALEAFLAARGPVVSVGFGSMASEDPGTLTALVLGAARDAGVRVVLLSGWGGLASVSRDDVFCAAALPHDWLFPRVAAIVHHGGAGTTGAALRAGVPSIVVPFTMDQPFWGARVATLGAGTPPIPRKRLTREALAAALRRAVSDEGLRARAAALGDAIRAEDGVREAVAHFARLR